MRGRASGCTLSLYIVVVHCRCTWSLHMVMELAHWTSRGMATADGHSASLPSGWRCRGPKSPARSSFGLPVIGSTASGPMEILDSGKYGIVVPSEDVGALSDAMCALLGDAGAHE